MGLLYHPGRPGETELCARWKASLAVRSPQLRVRRNYPYAGKGDGLTSYLRLRFPRDVYVGIELEVNQEIVFAAGPPLDDAASHAHRFLAQRHVLREYALTWQYALC